MPDMRTSRELFLEAVKGGLSAEVPVFPRDLTLGLDITGAATTEVFGPPYDPRASAEAILALQNAVGHDAVVGCIFGCMVTGFGVELGIPEKGVPYPKDSPFTDISALDAASPDSVRDGMLSGMRESYRIVRDKRDDLAVVMNLAGPVTNGGNLRNMEMLLMDMISDPDTAHRIMDFSVEAIISAMDYIGADLADALFLASATDNPDLLGDGMYAEYCIPALKRVCYAAKDMGMPSVFHPHGKFDDGSSEILDATVRTGIDCFQFSEENDGPSVMRRINGKCSIMGGPDVMTTLLNGTREEIISDTVRFLEDFQDHAYIMSCSCSLHRGFPVGNLSLMTSAAHAFRRGSAADRRGL